jgi:hypothetical protein
MVQAFVSPDSMQTGTEFRQESTAYVAVYDMSIPVA